MEMPSDGVCIALLVALAAILLADVAIIALLCAALLGAI